jgi:ATP/maltotriose-dependent transcriptional regulator MalT
MEESQMKKLFLLVAGCCLLAQAAQAADDTVRKVGGEQIKGTVKSLAKDKIVVEKSGKDETLKPFEVESIRFDDEPAKSVAIRSQISNGGYENALKVLEQIDPAALERAETKQEMQYLKAYCNAQLALGGGVDLAAAGKQMLDFLKANPDSYHFYAANELLGDMLVAAGKYENAVTYYKALADSPFDEYKMRAGVALGRARVSEKKYPQAQQEFETALDAAEKSAGPSAEATKQAAKIGLATCLAETGKPEEGVKLTNEVLAKLPAEEVDLHARAYVAQGNCYRKMPDHAKAALIAFLHVDKLYFSNAQAHAEALWNLAPLFFEIGKQDRAAQVTQLLKERYPNSPWAKL